MRPRRRTRRRNNVQVRGCGCCLPLALGMMSVPVGAVWAVVRAVTK